jgi:hypothetical protein
MVDQNLLTVFIALTTLSILIQTGIIAGLFYVTYKMSQQADRALGQSRRLYDPLHRIVDSLQTGSVRIHEFANSSRAKLKQTELQMDRAMDKVRQRIA